MEQWRTECDERRIAFFRVGEEEPFAAQCALEDHRPYIHPLRAPDRAGVLTEDAPDHHPWQHGLYVGLNEVNGIGFWLEGLGREPERDGSFHPEPLAKPQIEGECASWQVRCQWRGPEGDSLLDEVQDWTLRDLGEVVELDMIWRLTARVDIEFGQSKYGGLFLRMPYRDQVGGRALSSEGLSLPEIEGQPARWVAVAMPIAGRVDEAGVAIMDHPQNDGHPVSWRVDGQLGIAPSRCIASAWHLTQGQTAVNCYRVVAFTGAIDAADLESRWQAFAGGH
jgi:hypothetical protein